MHTVLRKQSEEKRFLSQRALKSDVMKKEQIRGKKVSTLAG